MELYLVRHAIAEERRSDLPDPERALTERGRRRFQRGLRGMLRLGLELDGVLTSPWRRARETAELLAEALGTPPPMPTDLLAQAPSPELLAELGQREARQPRLALVGHEPWLGELLAWLSAGHPTAGAGLHLRKGSLAGLSGDPSPWGMDLDCLWRPAQLRHLGR